MNERLVCWGTHTTNFKEADFFPVHPEGEQEDLLGQWS